MRIKLRLYPRDLDLIALKHNPDLRFNNVVRMALNQYVTTGYCRKVEVPPNKSQTFTLQGEECNITLNDDIFPDVIKWLTTIRPGMRSAAIKAIIRAAVSNPDLSLFALDSNLVIPEKQSASFDTYNSKRNKESKPVIDIETKVTEFPVEDNSEIEFDVDDEWFDNF